MDEVQVLEEVCEVQHEEVDLHNIIIGPDPDEIHIDDSTVIHHTEAYMILQIAEDDQCTGSTCVKVETGAGGNIMPLCVYQHLYPTKFILDGTPSGLHQLSTRLTAFNGRNITEYGTLATIAEWQPSAR